MFIRHRFAKYKKKKKILHKKEVSKNNTEIIPEFKKMYHFIVTDITGKTSGCRIYVYPSQKDSQIEKLRIYHSTYYKTIFTVSSILEEFN